MYCNRCEDLYVAKEVFTITHHYNDGAPRTKSVNYFEKCVKDPMFSEEIVPIVTDFTNDNEYEIFYRLMLLSHSVFKCSESTKVLVLNTI